MAVSSPNAGESRLKARPLQTQLGADEGLTCGSGEIHPQVVTSYSLSNFQIVSDSVQRQPQVATGGGCLTAALSSPYAVVARLKARPLQTALGRDEGLNGGSGETYPQNLSNNELANSNESAHKICPTPPRPLDAKKKNKRRQKTKNKKKSH